MRSMSVLGRFTSFFSEFCNTILRVFDAYPSRKKSLWFCFFSENRLYLLVEIEYPVFFSS